MGVSAPIESVAKTRTVPRRGHASGVFLSYRRADAPDAAGRIYDHLVSRFGKAKVFKDVDSIPVGLDFRNAIEAAVGRSHCILVVVGKRWLEGGDDDRKRLFEPDDPVRAEIELAFSAGVPVIPVLVNGAEMPKPSDLPAKIEGFAFLNAASVRPGIEFADDMKRLRSAMRFPSRGTRIWPAALISALSLILLIIAVETGFKWNSEKATERREELVVTPLIYSPAPTSKLVLRGINDSEVAETEQPGRSGPQPLGDSFFVDAIVSEFNNVFFLDLRIANRTDEPHLISGMTVTSRALEAESRPDRRAELMEKSIGEYSIRNVYFDVNVSDFRNPGESKMAVLSQPLAPKSVHRFVAGISGAPHPSLFHARPGSPGSSGERLTDGEGRPGAWLWRLRFDVEVTTSAGVILLKDLSAEFHSPSLGHTLETGVVDSFETEFVDSYHRELVDLAKQTWNSE